MDERDLREYYLLPFQKAIMEGHAQSFMVAYNVLNGAPCTAHPILRSIVMKEWGFDGMICTDAGGMPNLMRSQMVVASLPEAAAMAVKAGVTCFPRPAQPATLRKRSTRASSPRPTSWTGSKATSGCACAWENSIRRRWFPTALSPGRRNPGTA